MIIKGKSRGGPRQLGPYLLRKGKNESVRLFELKSPHATLTPTFVDWQILAGGTKGTLGLYHAQINPAAGYTMTPEQWTRAVDVLEEKLGLTGQPRAVVLHVKDGREHAHVVWQRTEIETMTLVSDAWNYRAHEQASQQLEKEFGHEHVPGKHGKRDRDKQKEPPKAELNLAEAQQQERSGLNARERKDTVTALFEQSDNGQALKAALEQHGYVLAQGDRRNFVIVDTAGHIHSLARQIRDEDGKQLREKELREFMSDIERASLPTPDQAKAFQLAAQEKQPAQAPDAPKPAEPTPVVSREEIAALAEALTKQHAYDAAKLVYDQENERRRLSDKHDDKYIDDMAEFDEQQEIDRERHEAALKDQRTGIRAFIHAVKLRFNPTLAAEEAKQRREAELQFERRLAKERAGEIALLKSQKQEQLETLAETHAQAREKHGQSYDHELDRRIQELADSKRIAQELQQERQARERERQRGRDGPEPPTWVR
jgi:hypothetical protein